MAQQCHLTWTSLLLSSTSIQNILKLDPVVDRIQNRTIFPVLNFLVLFIISGTMKKITYFANLRRVKINRSWVFLLIVIAGQLIFKRFPPLLSQLWSCVFC